MNKDQIKAKLTELGHEPIGSNAVVNFMLDAIKENPDTLEEALKELKAQESAGDKTGKP